jgi:hypothetical protein
MASFVIFPADNAEHFKFQCSSIKHYWSTRDQMVPRAIVRTALKYARKYKNLLNSVTK